MTDTVKKGELLLSDMSEPLDLMAQAHEALSRVGIPEEVLEWLGVSDDPHVSRLEEACDEVDAAIDAAEKCAMAACDDGDSADFERAVKGSLDDLTAVDVPGPDEVNEWVGSLTAAFESRLREGAHDFLDASVPLRMAKGCAVHALEHALLR